MNSKFTSSLNRIRISWGLGRTLLALLWLLAAASVFILMFGLVDNSFALPNESRERAALMFLIVSGILIITLIVRFVRVRPEDAAKQIDGSLRNARSDIADALSLTEQKDQSKMHSFLKAKAIEKAEQQMTQVPANAKLPLKGFGYVVLTLCAFGGLLVGVRTIHSEKFDTVANRLFHPSEDIPPFTNLKFELLANDLEIVYGGDLDIRVKLSGEEITDDVVCMIKNPNTGEIDELTSLKEARGIYVQRFNNILKNTEFSFRIGNARSQWHSIEVMLQPEIASTELEIIPPSYTKKESEISQLEGGELSVIEGSRVKLRISSNRPLGSGSMVIKDLEKEDLINEVTTKRLIDSKTVEFEWVVRESGKMNFDVFDVRNTKSKSSVQFIQKSVPDQAPEVALTSPGPRVLATPKMKLKLMGEVEDDFGLNEVSVYRSLQGFRDRGERVEQNIGRDSYDYNEGVDLGKIGVEPGQRLEFYLEAKDFNPSMLGVGASDPVVVEVISENDYAQILRDRAVMREFSKRYTIMSRQINEAKKSLEKLQEAMKAADTKGIEEAKKQATETHKKAKQMLKSIANDFEAFDMENRLKKIAADGAAKLSQNEAGLKKKGLTSDDVKKMLDKLGGAQKQAQKLEQDAQKMEKMRKVLAMAARFKQLYKNQESIRDRMNVLSREMAFGNDKNVAQLKSLGKLQEKNRKELDKFAIELKKRSDDLPDDFSEMKDSIVQFLDKMEELKIGSPMKSAAKAAKEGRSRDATEDAHLALQLMKQLMDESEGFG